MAATITMAGQGLVDAIRIMGAPLGRARPGPSLYAAPGWGPGPQDGYVVRRPVLLDACCGRGGAAVGYYAAGFDVVGVDIEPQPRYPFEFHQADGIDFIRDHGHLFDAIHVSAPCQGYSHLAPLATGDYPKLIGPFREVCEATGRPYVLENVEGARDALRDPITLCMSTWFRWAYRHRLFESNVRLLEPDHPEHQHPQAKLGRTPAPGEFHQVAGHFPAIREVRRQMPWADRDGIAEAIPPVFTDYLGRQLHGCLIDNESNQRVAAGLAW
jgi:DNA (cytosine-5)-methyltransferase 1